MLPTLAVHLDGSLTQTLRKYWTLILRKCVCTPEWWAAGRSKVFLLQLLDFTKNGNYVEGRSQGITKAWLYVVS